MSKKPRCECPKQSDPMYMGSYDPAVLDSRGHAPGQCPNDDVRCFIRGDQILWLCSACDQPGDVPATEFKMSHA